MSKHRVKPHGVLDKLTISFLQKKTIHQPVYICCSATDFIALH